MCLRVEKKTAITCRTLESRLIKSALSSEITCTIAICLYASKFAVYIRVRVCVLSNERPEIQINCFACCMPQNIRQYHTHRTAYCVHERTRVDRAIHIHSICMKTWCAYALWAFSVYVFWYFEFLCT